MNCCIKKKKLVNCDTPYAGVKQDRNCCIVSCQFIKRAFHNHLELN